MLQHRVGVRENRKMLKISSVTTAQNYCKKECVSRECLPPECVCRDGFVRNEEAKCVDEEECNMEFIPFAPC
ncbi:hypothetical protein ANCDUO_02037 [Ancylostoma duodenale]|uniref:Trypsin Inhibitor like cysteine rich domain protein n=1 Tax=Ancylostoma duodenale TaxID=51022 RepID=A0A0C2H1I8_9BILA|nr:hypothetical protein ANCDUO_02037 [Ancylostoma duodenale]